MRMTNTHLPFIFSNNYNISNKNYIPKTSTDLFQNLPISLRNFYIRFQFYNSPYNNAKENIPFSADID